MVLHAITGRTPTLVRDLRPEIPPEVASVVTHALEKSSELRYLTVRDLLAAIPAPAVHTGGRAPTYSETTPPTEATVGPVVGADERPSIAVLPFANMSPEKDQDYFCEGLAEELIDALARLDGLRVVARTSAFRFKGDAPDLREVGEKLNVKTVLEGSVRKAGNRLRINAQLINVADGYHLWTERYDRELDDIFAVQDEIARAVVTELKVKLLGAPEKPLVTRPTKSLEAYTCYMQGRHYRFSRNDPLKASRFYEEAVQHDPAYAAAWAGVAHAAIMAGYFLLRSPEKVSATARAAVGQALTFDDRLSEAHDALARIHFWLDWRWDEAEREYLRAIELDPGNVESHIGYATFLAWLGRTDEALTQLARAREIDPLSVYAFTIEGLALFVGRRFDEAIIACRQALDLQPGSALALLNLSLSYEASFQPELALATLRDVSEATTRVIAHWPSLGYALARAGQQGEARRMLIKMRDRSQREYGAPFAFAFVHLGLGELDEALAGC